MSDAGPEAVFTTRAGLVGGRRAVITVNDALKDLASKAWCPWHVTITILLDEELPNGDEEEALGRLEDDLHSLIRGTGEFDYVGRVTANGLREIHFYLYEQEAAHEALMAFIERGTPKELGHLLSYDPDWSEVDHLFDYA